MESNIRSALSIVAELRDGDVVKELSGAVHDALIAVKAHNKEATVTLTIRVKPFTQQNLVEPAITMVAEVEKKLPKEVPPATLFFINEDGNPQRTPARQEPLRFGVATAPATSPSTATGA